MTGPARPRGHRWRAALIGAATVAVLIGAWEASVHLGELPEFVLPSPSQVVATAVEQSSVLGQHVATTATEAVLGLAFGTALGWMLAIVTSAVPSVGHATRPVVLLSQTIPTVVLAPLMILWAGFGLTSKVVLVALTVFFPVLVAATAAIREVDAEHADVVAGLGGGRRHQLWLVRLPASVPGALAGLRIAATYAVGAAVVSEYLAGESGIGVFIQRSRKAYAVDQIFVGIVLIALLTAVLVVVIALLRRLAMPWHTHQTST
ncbi:ABC transporter permease [Demequina sp. TTPB684]|uniref:ABC transporter permease n=1 Tax=unclassified Demequina TaxID=2620311 RepID=UPI001CF47FEA|nr:MULTISPECIES: ABC transporter permease [unclassified Demequina]MCB2413955.1 ABC transporter permease [Demequina sp. TTPB684]UPU88692.1 ABC transporter permease [Demequina sp. TMPB413]